MIKPKHFITPEEYLVLEEKAPDKHEYWNGEIYRMAGASINHNQIVVNLTASLVGRLAGQACRLFATDIRLRVEKEDLYTYPDVMVICGKLEIDPHGRFGVLETLEGLDAVLTLHSLEIELALAAVYAQVEWAGAATP